MSTRTDASRRRIVVGVDGSKSSIDALLWAERLSTSLHAEIDAVTSWQYPTSYGMSGLAEWDPSADAGTLLADAVATAFGDSAPAGLQTSVRQGHPTNALLEASVGAELLVVGSRGHGGFVGMLIGATSAYCAEHASCAVLIAHSAP